MSHQILSVNGQPPLVIDDHNFRDFVPDGDGVVHTNHGDEFCGLRDPIEPQDFQCVMRVMDWQNSGLVEYDDQELAERLEDMWAAEASIMHRVYHTDSLRQTRGTCWIHGTIQAGMMLLEMAGLPYRTLSPASVAYHCYRNFGVNGGYPSLGVQKFQEQGASTIRTWPENGFANRYNTGESRAERIHNWLEEIVLVGSGEQALRRLLSAHCQGKPGGASFRWWRHYVASTHGRWNGRELQLGIRNSWGNNGYGDKGFGLLAGNRRLPQWGCVFMRMRQSPETAGEIGPQRQPHSLPQIQAEARSAQREMRGM